MTEQEIRKDERERIIKSLERSANQNGYCHKTSDGYTHLDWYRSLKSLVHELKVGKI